MSTVRWTGWVVLVVIWLGGCGGSQEESPREVTVTKAEKNDARPPAPADQTSAEMSAGVSAEMPPKMEARQGEAAAPPRDPSKVLGTSAGKDLAKIFGTAAGSGGISGGGGGGPGGAATANGLPPFHGGPESAANGGSGPAALQAALIDRYLASMQSASYAFNPPSPIKVARPVTVYFWLDPSVATAQLEAELQRALPGDSARVESGQTKWSPTMKATLNGADFDIKAIDPETQPVSATQRTTWSWDVTPLFPGEQQVLHLRLQAVLPDDLGPAKTITTLDREIRVDVTVWWLFDTYFERYWKWLLGGLGTALAGVIGWWWKKRTARAAPDDRE